jgi:hypothetical protein
MPPLPAPEIQTNRGLSAFGIDSYPSTTGDVVDATAEDAWVRNPTPSIARAIDRAPSREITGMEEFGIIGEINEPMLSAEDAQAKYGIKDHLKFDTDTPDRVAKDLHDLKQEELLRQNILSRAQGGTGEMLARFGTGLGVSILDPLNIASAFVPVVGQARYARMLTAAGEGALARAGVRAGVGAVEGFAGAAMLEPIVYGVAKSEQADYDLTDSLLNLAFGTAIGGGMHAGLGRLGDMIRDRGGAEETLRGAIAQVSEDRPVSVANTLRTKLLNTAERDLSTAFDELVPDEIKASRVIETPEGPKGLAERLALAERNLESARASQESILAQQAGRAETAPLALEAEQTRITEAGKQDREGIASLRAELETAREAVSLKQTEYEAARNQADMLREAGASPTDRKLQRAEAQAEKRKGPYLAAQSKAEAVERQIAGIEARGSDRNAQLDNFRANQDRRLAGVSEQESSALRNAEQKLNDARAAYEAVTAERDAVIREQQRAAMAELRRELSDYARTMSRTEEAEIRALESMINTPEAKVSGGDMQAIQSDIDLFNAQIAELRKAGVVSEEDMAVLKAADEQAAKAEMNAKATEAAGLCQMVRG